MTRGTDQHQRGIDRKREVGFSLLQEDEYGVGRCVGEKGGASWGRGDSIQLYYCPRWEIPLAAIRTRRDIKCHINMRILEIEK